MQNHILNDVEKDPKERSLGRLLSFIVRYGNMYLSNELREYEFAGLQFHIIHLLPCDGSMRQDELTKKLGVDKAVMTRALKEMLNQGYICKDQDPDDRRSYIISLTENGRSMQEHTKSILRTYTHRLLRDFSDEDRKRLFELLDRVLVNVIEADKELSR